MKKLVILALLSSILSAQQGKKLFEAKCAVCHSADSNEGRVGPSLKGAKDGTLTSGRNATPEVVLKQLNSGGGGMPVFKDLLTAGEKNQLILYVLSL
jgi:mono/diheme cytochrome c family protein